MKKLRKIINFPSENEVGQASRFWNLIFGGFTQFWLDFGVPGGGQNRQKTHNLKKNKAKKIGKKG